MRIGLVGAPGAGKTALAHALKKSIETAEPGLVSDVQVIDKYAELVEEKGNLAIGPYASYATSVAIALLRFGLERGAKDATTITCGTHVETCVYLAVDGMLKQQYAPTDEFKEAARQRTGFAMQFLGAVMSDDRPYDALFFLPVHDAEENWIQQFDANIKDAFELYEVQAVTLEGTAEECLAKAVEVIYAAPVEAS